MLKWSSSNIAEQVMKGGLELKGDQLITSTVSKGFWTPENIDSTSPIKA